MPTRKQTYPEGVARRLCREIDGLLKKEDEDLNLDPVIESVSHRSCIIQIGGAVEKLLFRVLSEVCGKEAESKHGLKSCIELLSKAYSANSKRSKSEGRGFLLIERYIWYLFNTRNWVSHLGRSITEDDYVECLRAFREILQWHIGHFHSFKRVWTPAIMVKGIAVVETGQHLQVEIPKSVQRLKEQFEDSFIRGDFDALGKCFHSNYRSDYLDWSTRSKFIKYFKEFAREIGTLMLDFKLEILGFEMDNDASLWLQVEFKTSKGVETIGRGVQLVRLTDIKQSSAKIVEIRDAQ